MRDCFSSGKSLTAISKPRLGILVGDLAQIISVNLNIRLSRTIRDFAATCTNPERNDPRSTSLNHLFQLFVNAIKVFFDGSVSTSNNYAGAGVLIQAPDGKFLHGLARQFPDVLDSDLAEVLALRQALLLCRKFVVVQGDSALIILAANKDSDGPSSCSPILDDVIYLCQDLPIRKLSWIRRDENMITHAFAKFAKFFNVIETIWNDQPNFGLMAQLLRYSTDLGMLTNLNVRCEGWGSYCKVMSAVEIRIRDLGFKLRRKRKNGARNWARKFYLCKTIKIIQNVANAVQIDTPVFYSENQHHAKNPIVGNQTPHNVDQTVPTVAAQRYIADINGLVPTKTIHFHIVVRVMTIWKMIENKIKNVKSIELALIDAQGSKIQATIPARIMKDFQKYFLQEGCARRISCFDHYLNISGGYRCSKHKYKIVFRPDTLVQSVGYHDIPNHVFEFTPFAEITNFVANFDFCFDLLGHIIGYSDPIIDNGKKRITVELEDERADRLKVTLWDEHADKVYNMMTNNPDYPVVLIVQEEPIIISFGDCFALKGYSEEEG
ncbi:OLC1v1036681C1 [Oldenlandia corymbosa var. corymbosa]|uniref:OLC1v1036681C1 n=1 Tax=Oldenlandia corymbosa var. corymbosa TaxID=529605 RepID=A0AAV1CW02_OLDCO|nr:OLC1v1036681C1 [Oldenlandia corymbosa var. corymbosa]